VTAREKDYSAIALGILAAALAHASGKPWWVDWPLLGDAFDIGFLAAISFRVSFTFLFGPVK